MSVVRRMTALATALVAVLASGTAVTTTSVPAHAADEAADGTITIKAISADGTALGEGRITVWRRDGDSVVRLSGVPEQQASAGWYRLSDLPQGVPLTLSIAPSPSDTSDGDSIETFLGHEPTARTAEWFTLDETARSVRLPNLRLAAATSVTGTLTDLQGRPWTAHSPVRVRAWIRTPDGMAPGPFGETDGGQDGTFTIRGMWPGVDATVGLEPREAPVTAPAFLGGAASAEDAELFTTRADKTVQVGRVAASLKAAWVTGSLLDDDQITVHSVGLARYWGPYSHRSVRVDRTTGRWGTHVLWGDEARFRVTSTDVDRWAGGGTSYETAGVYRPDGESELQVEPLVVPREGAVVRGRVLDDLGRPIARAGLNVAFGESVQYPFTDADGVFELTGRPLGEDLALTVTEHSTGRTATLAPVHVDRPLVELPDITVRGQVPVVSLEVVDEDPRTTVTTVHLVNLGTDRGDSQLFAAGTSAGSFAGTVWPDTYGIYVERTFDVGSFRDEVVGTWWGGRRPEPGDPYTVTVSGVGTTEVGEVRLPPLVELTGTVRDSAGVGLGHTVITASGDYGSWPRPSEQTVVTNSAGTYSVLAPAGARVQLEVERTTPGVTYPVVRRATVAEAPEGESRTEDFVLEPVWDRRVGAVAGVRDEACLQKRSEQARRELELTLVDGLLARPRAYSDPRPSDWVDTPTVVAIAPLMGVGGDGDFSWGRTEDGSLCFLTVTDEVIHQVWIAPPGSDGRSEVTINYDHVQSPVRPDTPPAELTAGWSDGLTPVVLPGAGAEGDYDDDGRYALVRGSRGSSQPGRYRFMHSGFPTGVSVDSVSPPTIVGEPRPGEVVRVDPGTWSSDGRVHDDMVFTYSWSRGTGEPGGATRLLTHADGGKPLTVTVRAWSAGASFAETVTATVDVEPATGPDPVVVTTSHGTASGGVPVVWDTEAQHIVVHGCADVADPRYTVAFTDGTPALTGPMTPGPFGADGLRYFYISLDGLPTTSVRAQIRTNVAESCTPGAPLISIWIYIDPAGTVTDQYGFPLDHARVTLFRSDSEHGDYTKVPAGSELMSAMNRENPTTAYGGSFRWDVVPGWYKVRAAHDDRDCQKSWSVPMAVPPARVSVLVRLHCWGRGLVVEGSSEGEEVGDTLTATAKVPPGLPDAVVTAQWSRNGIAIPGATGTTYTLGPYDVGRAIGVTYSATRSPFLPDDGRGRTITFEPVIGSTGWEVPGEPIPLPTPTPTTSPTPTPTPSPTPTQGPAPTGTSSGRATSTTTLEVRTAHAATRRVKAVVRVRAATGVAPTGVVEVRRQGKVVGRAVLRVRDRGRVVVRLTGLKRPGTHRLVASYLGSPGVAPSQSARKTVRIGAVRPHPRVLHLEW